MNEAPRQILDTDTLVKSLWDRARAFSDVGGRTAALALAELKLAASSATLAIGIAVLLVLMTLVMWSLTLVAGFLLLKKFGMEPLSALAVLMSVQAIVCGALAWLLKTLLDQMRFINTRRAVRETLSNESYTDTPSETAA